MKDPTDNQTIDAFPAKRGRGGRRPGAGRKRTAAPTKVIRVPKSKLEAVQQFLRGENASASAPAPPAPSDELLKFFAAAVVCAAKAKSIGKSAGIFEAFKKLGYDSIPDELVRLLLRAQDAGLLELLKSENGKFSSIKIPGR